jgi:hypothetical protein
MTDHAYIQHLAAELDALISEFTIPCINRPYSPVPTILVRRRTDGHGDGWAVLDHDDHAWTGTSWRHLTTLAASETYRYTRRQALAEATRIAPLQAQAAAIVRPAPPPEATRA